jgi:DNA-binding NarL/FixJ family response regulator
VTLPTLVVVDDEPSLRRLLVLLLGRDGRFDLVAEASDGEAALAAVERHEPDLLLLDLGLPVLDGLEVLERLAGRDRPRVVVLTGFADAATLDQARSLGAAACLVKGDGFAEVADTLHEVSQASRGS